MTTQANQTNENNQAAAPAETIMPNPTDPSVCPDPLARRVEEALLKRAMGYQYTETTMGPGKNPQSGEWEWATVKEVIKEVPPELSALKYWLINRCPERWRDKPEPESEETEATVTFEGLVKEWAE